MPHEPKHPLRCLWRLRPTQQLSLCAIGLSTLVLGCAAWLLFDSRRAAYDATIRSAENLVLGLEHDVRLTVESLDLSLKAAAIGARLPELETLRPAVRQAILFDGAVGSEAYGGIFVTDETGRVLHDSMGLVPRFGDIPNRDAFLAHRETPGLGLLITGPRRGRLSGLWKLDLSRRVDRADGSFAGIVSGTIRLDEIQRLFASMRLGSDSRMSLVTLQGRVLAREPSPERSVGRDVSTSQLFHNLAAPRASHSPTETLVLRSGPSQVDGIDRVVIYRQVGHLPLGMIYGIPESDIYAGWAKRAILVGLVLGMSAAAAVTLAWGLRRELVRRSSAEHAAQASASQTRLLTDNASDLLLQVDWDSTCRFVSPACHRLLGYQPDNLLGHRWLELVHPEDQLLLTSSLLELQLGDSVSPALYRVRHHDGSWRDMEAHGRALPSAPEGGVVSMSSPGAPGAIIALRDVTDRILFEAKLRQAHRMEALGQLTAGVAHDFNNMLQAQLGCLELLLDELDECPQPLHLANQALALGERGARLTHQLLSFSRQQFLSPQPIPLHDFLATLAETLRRTLGPKVTLTTVIEPGTFAPYADRAHLESALLNLAINARDAMPGGGTIHIEARPACAMEAPDASGPRMVLIVRDTGLGMDAATLERACEPFFTTKGSYGTGLGLASVQGFASQSGGTLQIESAPGQGTAIQLVLPTAVETPGCVGVPARPGRCHGRLLLVDDTRDVLVVIGAFLKGIGFDVVEALGPQDALDALWQGPFDCLVTDYAMPGMTGGELIDVVRKTWPELPALVITGWADVDELEQLAGRADVLRKPFKRDELRQCVVRIIAAAESDCRLTLIEQEN